MVLVLVLVCSNGALACVMQGRLKRVLYTSSRSLATYNALVMDVRILRCVLGPAHWPCTLALQHECEVFWTDSAISKAFKL